MARQSASSIFDAVQILDGQSILRTKTWISLLQSSAVLNARYSTSLEYVPHAKYMHAATRGRAVCVPRRHLATARVMYATLVAHAWLGV